MAAGSLENMGGNLDDRTNPVEKYIKVMVETYGLLPSPMTCKSSEMTNWNIWKNMVCKKKKHWHIFPGVP
jgi:hypothetical protein